MNNYILIEIDDLKKKLNGYNMLFNYRMTNMCVKAEPIAMLPVTVNVANLECNIEEVATATRPDEFTFDVVPKNQNNLQDIIDGVFDVHPEFKMEIKTDKDENDKEVRHIIYTMPEVNKDRRDLLTDTVKTFHKECKANFDATYAKLQARLVEPYSRMKAEEVDEANQAFKDVLDTISEESDKMLEAKLVEIEEGYQRYLKAHGEDEDENDGESLDFTKSMRLQE